MEAVINFWDFTDPFVQFMQGIFKLPEDMMRLAICLIATYPAILFHRYVLQSANQRLGFSLFFGLFLTFFSFKWQTLYFVLSAGLTYGICAFIPIKHAPKLVVLITFGILSFGHWQRYHYLYLQYTVVWTTPMMVFILKLHAFAWSYYDGQFEPKPRMPTKNRIVQLPGLFQYFSYCFFFVGFLTGPVGEFNDYINFSNRSLFKNEKDGKIPFDLQAVLWKLGINFVGIAGFYLSKLVPESYCGTEEFITDNGFLYRTLYLLIAVEIGFTKYYFAWGNGEAHAVLIGIAYNGRDKNQNILWNRIQMINVIPFRLAHKRFDIQSNWNICSGEWLKYYIYLRIPEKYQKSLNPAFITFMVSAYWHGFYPGYYLFFGLYAFYYFWEEAFDYNFKRI